jgi:IS30 family transposase
LVVSTGECNTLNAFTGGVMGKRRKRFTTPERRELWIRWKSGQTLRQIGEALARPPLSVFSVIRSTGGLAPRERTRSARSLSLLEREEISRGLASGESIRSVARRLDRAPSSVSREIRRNAKRPITYRALEADGRAWKRAKRPKRCRLSENQALRDVVASKLSLDWSPEQISSSLRMSYPGDSSMQISHETIYRTLYVQARGALKKELVAHLRRQQPLRHTRGKKSRTGGGQIIGAVSISERPPQIEDRAVPGHWEGDLLAGTYHSHIATLVERRSRYVVLVRLDSKDSETVVNALVRRVRHLPEGLMLSLTWDRGPEMARHKTFTVATDVQVYFCDPRSPWQRGSNENTNGLLRQYFPKGMDLKNVTQRQLDAVAHRLNTRPRETLNWKTPAEVLAATVATTG